MPESAADRKSIRRREKAAKLAAIQRAAVIREVMSTTHGRAWVWDLLAGCHIFVTTFTGDSLTSAFAEGERNVGTRLLSDIMVTCPDQYIQAMREANERNTLDERRSSTESDGRDSGSGEAVNYDEHGNVIDPNQRDEWDWGDSEALTDH